MARPKVSDETKKKMAELRDSAKSLAKPLTTGETSNSSSVVDTLGQIYDLMVSKRTLELQNRLHDVDLKIKEKEEQDNFNKLLIDSLKPEKKKTPKKVPKKKPKKEKTSLFSKLATGVKVVGGAAITAATVYETKKAEEAKVPPTTPPVPPTETQITTSVPTTKATPITGMDDVKQMVKRHEGVRNTPYKDSLGLWTVGVGHLIGDGKTLPKEWNRTFSNEEVNNMFEQDFAHHVKIAEQTPGYSQSNDGGKAAFIDLAFNMGKWWPKWPNTKKKLEEGNFQSAATSLKDSKWYQQVGNRAKEIVALVAQAGDGRSSSIGISTGIQLASVSETNKDMREQLERQKSVQIANTNKIVNVNQAQTTQTSSKFDDRSPHEIKKATV